MSHHFGLFFGNYAENHPLIWTQLGTGQGTCCWHFLKAQFFILTAFLLLLVQAWVRNRFAS